MYPKKKIIEITNLVCKVGESVKGVHPQPFTQSDCGSEPLLSAPLSCVRCFRPGTICIDLGSLSAAGFYNSISYFSPVTCWNETTAYTEIQAN